MKKTKKISKKPRYLFGNTLNDNQQPIAQGSALAGQAITATSVNPTSSTIGGALSGAAAGSAFGPIGMAGGAIIGGITSFENAKSAKANNKRLLAQQQNMHEVSLMNNAGNALAKGGKIKSKLAGGGETPNDPKKTPISVETWKSQGINSPDTVNRGVMYKMPYSLQNKLYNTPIPSNVDPNQDSFIQVTPGMPNPNSLLSKLNRSNKVATYDIAGNPTGYNRPQGSNIAGLAKGGRLAKKLGVVAGGALEKVSNDAVEVKANNPSQTDSVELEDAYVDHNEIIDDKNRVFSDELGFAKIAKRLEKQKSKNPRFEGANSHIDSKLDQLFEEQEQTKNIMAKRRDSMGKVRAELGGLLELTGPFPMRPLKKKKLALGGEEDDDPTKGTTMFHQDLVNRNMAHGQSSTERTRNSAKVDFNEALPTLATITPNIVSSMAQSRLKGPAVPQLERSTALKRINPDAQLVEADRDANLAIQTAKNNTGQGASLASAAGSVLARKFANKNQIYNQNQQINAQIQHQEAGLNVGIGARNAERTNDYLNNTNEFNNLQQKLSTENVSNLGQKLMQQRREKNQMQLDKDKALISSYAYRDSGVRDRLWNDLGKEHPGVAEKYDPRDYNNDGKPKYSLGSDYYSKGGKIHIKKSHRGLLHKNLGIPEGKKIPKSKLVVHPGDSPALKKRKIFAQNFGHKK